MNNHQHALNYLSPALQTMIYEEQVLHAKNLKYPWPEDASVFHGELDVKYRPETRIVFKLPYYLVPKHKALFYSSLSISPEIHNQLIKTINNKDYYVFFVHP